MRAEHLVLIVDDYLDARELYETSLRFYGFRTLTAGDAQTAFTLAKKERPDLILMDGGLPGMSGWDAVKALKADPVTREICVLMLTGHVMNDAHYRAAEAGADGLIPKPCLPDELANEIRIALASSCGTRADSASAQHGRSLAATDATHERLRRGRTSSARR